MAKLTLEALPPKEAIKSFRQKGYSITFDHEEMQREEHAYNFTVAKATQLDILQDIRQSVDKALADGVTFRDFARDLKPALQEKGWWGRKVVVDPKTGEEREVQLGSSRRLKIIYDTNLRTAYAAGRWEQAERVKKSRPYLRYIAVLDERTRTQHRQFNDTILPVDDPFWNEHYPPNGWRCRCTVQQLSERDLERRGLKLSNTPPTGAPKTYIDKKSGNTLLVPPGLDPGFAYNVGKSRMKAMVPPPLDWPMKIPFFGSPLDLPAPPARPLDPVRLLPADLSEKDYVEKFLAEFGASIGKPVPFVDAAGETIIISDDLFRTGSGGFKVKRRDRHIHTLLMADAIRNPDEIYHVWQEYPKGQMSLARVYLSRWLDASGRAVGGFTMLTVSRLGWTGVTTFKADKISYINQHRQGALVYRRSTD